MEDYLQEVGALTMRWVKRLSREKFSMVFTLFQPMVFWLIFFGNLFQRTANAEVVQAPSYIAFLAAGGGVLTILNNRLAGGGGRLFCKGNGLLGGGGSPPLAPPRPRFTRVPFVVSVPPLDSPVYPGLPHLFR